MMVFLPVMLVYVTPGPGDRTWLLALLVTTAAGARYAWIVTDGRRRLYEMSFWVFSYVFLGLAPLVQLRTEQNPATTPRIDTTLNATAMTVVIVGLAAFAVGLRVRGIRRPAARKPFVLNGTDLPRTLLLTFFALGVDALFLVNVGLGALFSTRDELAQAVDQNWSSSSTSALIGAITAMSLLVAFVALVKCVGQTKSREWPLIALTIVVGLALAVTVNPISSARYVFGTTALAIAAVFGLFATAARFRLTAILWVVALIVLFPLADAFRYSSAGEVKANTVVESLTSPDFDAFAQINNTLLYVQRHGVTHGEQAVGVVLFWVPRQIWPDKPRDTGIVLSESRGYRFQNLSAPIWAELYINGGWLLLLGGMVTLGAVVRSRDWRIEQSLRQARAPGIAACVLPFYLMILLRGSLLQAMSYLAVILVASAFVGRWERVK
jgi:hypothetical protein